MRARLPEVMHMPPELIQEMIEDWAARLQGRRPLRTRPMARDPPIFQDSVHEDGGPSWHRDPEPDVE